MFLFCLLIFLLDILYFFRVYNETLVILKAFGDHFGSQNLQNEVPEGPWGAPGTILARKKVQERSKIDFRQILAPFWTWLQNSVKKRSLERTRDLIYFGTSFGLFLPTFGDLNRKKTKK